jgi:hypothetical protein
LSNLEDKFSPFLVAMPPISNVGGNHHTPPEAGYKPTAAYKNMEGIIQMIS